MDVKEKNTRRWNFVLQGAVAIIPFYDEEGDLQFVLMESDTFTAKCRTSLELENAVDIAMHRAGEPVEMRIQ